MSELNRLRSLHAYRILDTVAEEQFDRIVRLAQSIVDAPMAAISLVDRDRQWFKARRGIDVPSTPRPISFCTHAIGKSGAFVVEDTHSDPLFMDNPLVIGAPFLRFYVGIPLRGHSGENVGTLCCLDTVPRSATARQIESLQDLGQIVIDELELGLVSRVDPVTGVLSRRRFAEEMDREIARVRRYFNKLSCAILDVDGFAELNLQLGKHEADRLLQQVGKACQAAMRTTDIVGRVGPDEFGVLLPETSILGAFEAAERIRTIIAEITAAQGRKVSVSGGVAEYDDRTLDTDVFLQRADVALLQARLGGGNRTAFFGNAATIPLVSRSLCAAG